MQEDELVDAIYEAAVVPGLWPGVLDLVARSLGAKGGFLMNRRCDDAQWLASPVVQSVYEKLLADGWAQGDDRIPELVARRHKGFLTDADIAGEARLAALPLYNELLIPVGFHAAAATSIQVAEDELVLTVEGFASHAEAQACLPALDRLRRHLARAIILASRAGLERARATVGALSAIGAPAALLGTDHCMIARNDLFAAALPAFGMETATGLRLLNAAANAKYGGLLAALANGCGDGGSLTTGNGFAPLQPVLHVLPLRGAARDVFTGAVVILMLSIPNAPNAPDVAMIQDLLGLTHAEGRVAQHLACGSTIATYAAASGVSEHTVRAHVKRIFAKTGLSRQSELVAVLGTIARPGG